MQIERGISPEEIHRFRLAEKHKVADVAQLVEQLIRNQQVSGSSPLVGSRKSL